LGLDAGLAGAKDSIGPQGHAAAMTTARQPGIDPPTAKGS